jgi:hypothetical protein
MRVVETRTVEAVARATADLASAEVSSAAGTISDRFQPLQRHVYVAEIIQ